MEYDGRIQSSAKWNLRVSAYCRLLGLRASRHSNMPFDHFEHWKRLKMRTLDSLAALHTCHIFLQRGKPKHHVALEAQWCGVGPLAPYLKKKVQILSILLNRPSPVWINFGSILALLIRCLPSRCWSSKHLRCGANSDRADRKSG